MTGNVRTNRKWADEYNLTLRVLAVLLHYPDGDLFSSLEEIASAADHLQPTDMQSAIRAFIAYLKDRSLLQVQEGYTAAFDVDPAATLNMTFHMHGDSEKRAAALARLQRSYERAGWERATGELPDYLPLMLEFLSVCGHPEHAGVVWKYLEGLGVLVTHLEKEASAYAALLHPLARMTADGKGWESNGGRPAENLNIQQEMSP